MWTKKTTSEKANFCSNTLFSLYFKFRAKKFQAAKPLAFFALLHVLAWPKSLLQFDQKSWKDVNRSLKKRQRPNTIQILSIVKNQEHRNIAPLSLQLSKYFDGSTQIKKRGIELSTHIDIYAFNLRRLSYELSTKLNKNEQMVNDAATKKI